MIILNISLFGKLIFSRPNALYASTPKAMKQADKVKALVSAGVDRLKIQEQLDISKASYYRCLKIA